MSITVEQPVNVRELTHYVEHEHPGLRPTYNSGFGQLLVTGQPGQAQPPAALREILASNQFEMQAIVRRGRWIGIVNAADDGGNQ